MLKSVSNGSSSNNSNSNSNRSIWYIDANDLYGCAMMQKLFLTKVSYKDFKYYITSLDNILNTPDDSDYDYYIVCDIDYNDNRKNKTSN